MDVRTHVHIHVQHSYVYDIHIYVCWMRTIYTYICIYTHRDLEPGFPGDGGLEPWSSQGFSGSVSRQASTDVNAGRPIHWLFLFSVN